MHRVMSRAVPVIVATALVVGVHGAELFSVARAPARTESHDCGCDDGCSCKRPAKRCCGSETVEFRTACGCGCGGAVHLIEGPRWQTVLTLSCSLTGPSRTWIPVHEIDGPLAWRLAHELDHPPKPIVESPPHN